MVIVHLSGITVLQCTMIGRCGTLLLAEMEIHDYNGTGQWSVESILSRYERYAQRAGAHSELIPRVRTEGTVNWIYPIMDEVIAGIERGDKACIAIGIEFIEEDQHFPFGRILKSNAARALRHAELSQEQVERVRRRVVSLLLSGSFRREFREYVKLLRVVGMGSWWPTIEQEIDRQNPYMMRYYEYLRRYSDTQGKAATLPRKNRNDR